MVNVQSKTETVSKRLASTLLAGSGKYGVALLARDHRLEVEVEVPVNVPSPPLFSVSVFNAV